MIDDREKARTVAVGSINFDIDRKLANWTCIIYYLDPFSFFRSLVAALVALGIRFHGKNCENKTLFLVDWQSHYPHVCSYIRVFHIYFVLKYFYSLHHALVKFFGVFFKAFKICSFAALHSLDDTLYTGKLRKFLARKEPKPSRELNFDLVFLQFILSKKRFFLEVFKTTWRNPFSIFVWTHAFDLLLDTVLGKNTSEKLIFSFVYSLNMVATTYKQKEA